MFHEEEDDSCPAETFRGPVQRDIGIFNTALFKDG